MGDASWRGCPWGLFAYRIARAAAGQVSDPAEEVLQAASEWLTTDPDASAWRVDRAFCGGWPVFRMLTLVGDIARERARPRDELLKVFDTPQASLNASAASAASAASLDVFLAAVRACLSASAAGLGRCMAGQRRFAFGWRATQWIRR